MCSGLAAEDVGRSAAEQLISELSHEGCVDAYLQDQVICITLFVLAVTFSQFVESVYCQSC